MAICPICGAEAKARKENPDAPFCSARCKTIDLGKWMSEDYRVPSEDDPPEGLTPLDPDEEGDSPDEIVRH